MIPISDVNARRHGLPIVTIAIITVNAAVFLYQLTLTDAGNTTFIRAYGVVPLEITTGRDLPPGIPFPVWVTLFTSMFMHGGWMHIIGNMLYLWVFGDNVEDRLGAPLYLAFYLVCGLAADAAQILSDTSSRIPSLGASGAVAGVLGAYLVLYPGHRVNTLIFFGIFFRTIQLPALVVLGFWAVLQIFNSLFAGPNSGVAYWAHTGGFVVGAVIILLLVKGRNGGRRSSAYSWDS